MGIQQYYIYKNKEKMNQTLLIEQHKALDNIKKEIIDIQSKAVADIQKLQDKIVSAKSTIKNSPPKVIQKEEISKPNLQTIVKYWHPIVVYVFCSFNKNDGTIVYQSGSGTLSRTSKTTSGNLSIKVITNKHVLVADGFNGPSACSVDVPFNKIYTMVNDGTSDITGREDVDIGGIVINNPDTYLENLPLLKTVGIGACGNIPDLGSPVAILGYPGIGSRSGITITQGIISAYEGNYYVTDAKIEHGNSGGAAIDINNNCFLGIPTAAISGTVESLGRILKWQNS